MAIRNRNRTVKVEMRRTTCAFMAAVLCGLASCSAPPPADSVENVTPSEAYDLIQAAKADGCSLASLPTQRSADTYDPSRAGKGYGCDLVVLDVRTPAEFAPEHIEGAINICLECPGTFAKEIENLDRTREYLVYCRTGRRSAIAANELAAAGFTTLYNMTGGIVDWKNAGYPIVSEP